jgi:hypothetical protein
MVAGVEPVVTRAPRDGLPRLLVLQILSYRRRRRNDSHLRRYRRANTRQGSTVMRPSGAAGELPASVR